MAPGAFKRRLSPRIAPADASAGSVQRPAQNLRASPAGIEQRLRTRIVPGQQNQGFASLVRLLHCANRQSSDATGVSLRRAKKT